jgi:D-3-phosphoglycerate dehydrogenase
MNNPVVLVTSPAIPEEALALLREIGAETHFMHPPIDEKMMLEEFARRRYDAVLMRGPAPFTPAVFAAAKGLKIVSKHGAGHDSIDVAAATAHGVAVMVTNGANAAAVAEHSLALMLALSRELAQFDAGLRKGVWKKPHTRVRDFAGRTVGIVGYGHIGKHTARLAQSCGAKIVVHSRARAELPAGMEWEDGLERLLPRVDILSLHVPLTDRTRGMIGAKQIALMRPGAFIVNTSRGNLIDEPAMIAALQDGRLGGAGLDVFAQEPPDSTNPLFSMPNVIVTPHIASATDAALTQGGIIFTRNVVSYLRGEVYDPANFVNPEVFRKQK